MIVVSDEEEESSSETSTGYEATETSSGITIKNEKPVIEEEVEQIVKFSRTPTDVVPLEAEIVKLSARGELLVRFN